LSPTYTSSTLKCDGIIVAKAWFVRRIEPWPSKAMFAGES
jgi:hypothetical protein